MFYFFTLLPNYQYRHCERLQGVRQSRKIIKKMLYIFYWIASSITS
ncbi:hypothetical protein [Rickettsia felis]|nr:hypothetical protein [Rickettsia felis]